ncbi:MAG: prepilin-type N-terminal cleavage/methylation domain-containing protein [Phycisphaerae bacterium]|nr:prepilin-type N-terminal cleavage/methylation domain-containing protein [Phycisphaerae bacterium]
MHDTGRARARSYATPRRRRRTLRGLTLVELLVSLAIVLVLFSLLVVAGQQVRNALRRSRAQQQMQLVADAIDRYAKTWPAWRDTITGSGAQTSDRGWPHWCGAAAFPVAAYTTETDFNDSNTRDVSDDDDPASGGRTDVEAAAECLAFALTTADRGTPLLATGEGTGVRTYSASETPPRVYPKLLAAASPANNPRRILEDPWGNPLRYFWVVRDTDSQEGWRAITSADSTGPNDPANDPFFAPAQGIVVESAGPDGRYGNVWRRTPTAQQLEDATDNLWVKP